MRGVERERAKRTEASGRKGRARMEGIRETAQKPPRSRHPLEQRRMAMGVQQVYMYLYTEKKKNPKTVTA